MVTLCPSLWWRLEISFWMLITLHCCCCDQLAGIWPTWLTLVGWFQNPQLAWFFRKSQQQEHQRAQQRLLVERFSQGVESERMALENLAQFGMSGCSYLVVSQHNQWNGWMEKSTYNCLRLDMILGVTCCTSHGDHWHKCAITLASNELGAARTSKRCVTKGSTGVPHILRPCSFLHAGEIRLNVIVALMMRILATSWSVELLAHPTQLDFNSNLSSHVWKAPKCKRLLCLFQTNSMGLWKYRTARTRTTRGHHASGRRWRVGGGQRCCNDSEFIHQCRLTTLC